MQTISIAKISNTRRPIAFLLAILFLFLCVGLAVINSERTDAFSVGDWDAGRIIDNSVFTNTTTMSVNDIQQFLNTKVPICDTWHAGLYGSSGTWYGPPFTCLKDYTENGLSAAQIIYNVSQQYQINPQVFIVLLQKEQSLITDTWPAPYQYRSATGYACGDTSACESKFYGLTAQLHWAGTLFHTVVTGNSNWSNPYSSGTSWFSPYILGNNKIYYNPGPCTALDGSQCIKRNPDACSSSIVNIKNSATQSLYDYTPYQPNSATLDWEFNNGPPVSSAYPECGAFGNVNFLTYFTDWFGSTIRNLVRTSDGGVYLIENGVKRAFPSETIFLSYQYKWSDVLAISDAEINIYTNGEAMTYNTHLRDGHLVTSPSVGIYVIENGLKRPFPNEETFFSYGYKLSDALVISSAELNLIPDGATMTYSIHFRDGQLLFSPSNGVYLIENGTKRAFPNEAIFFSYTYKWSNIITTSSAELNLIPDGAAMLFNTHLRDGHLVTSPSVGIYVIENGFKRPFPNEETFLSYSYKFSDALVISSAELNLIPDGTAMDLKK